MKVLHFFRNARRFVRNAPFFSYLFRADGLDSEISDFMKAGETYPAVQLPVYSRMLFYEEDLREHIEKFKPSILHCHDYALLPELARLGDYYGIRVVFSIYRHTLNDLRDNIAGLISSLEMVSSCIVSSSGIKSWLEGLALKPPVSLIGEVLDASYNFRPSRIDETKKSVFTFAILISEPNEDYINNVHVGLEKILMTNNELKISWICFEDQVKKLILKDTEKRSLSKYVSITELQNFPMLVYEGLITDGNQKRLYSDEQYLYIILSALKEGKLLLTRPEPGLEDILINGSTCLIIPDYTSGKLSHLIHFFISFPEEIVNISSSARKFYDENHSFELNAAKLMELYEKILE